MLAENKELEIATAESKQMHDQTQETQKRLQERVRKLGFSFPAQSMVRQQGDCFPDSVAHHIFNFMFGPIKDHREWMTVRPYRSFDIREVVCDFMINNPNVKPLNSEVTLAEILHQPDWKAYCNAFREPGVKVENPFIAATALLFGFPIHIISSLAHFDTPIVFDAVARETDFPPLYLANHQDVHFEPLIGCNAINLLDMDDVPSEDAHTQANSKRRRARGGEQSSRVDELARDPRPLHASSNEPLRTRRGTKRVNLPADPGLSVSFAGGVTATEREALSFYQPWFDVISRRPAPAIETEQGQPVVDPLLLKAIDHKAHMHKRIPPRARQALIAAVKPALQTMVGGIQSDNSALFNKALQAFLVVPQFALAQRRSAPAKAADIEASITRFMDGPTLENGLVRRPAGQGSLTPRELAIRKAIRPATHGAMLKATQRMESLYTGLTGICEPTADVMEQLRGLHPAPSEEEVLPSPHDSSPSGLPVSRARLRKAGKKIANGSAADVFGWTGELMTPLLRDKECLSCLTIVAAHIRDGRATGAARDWLLASWLIALDKGNSKIRPIAGGTILFKLVATYLTQEAAGAAHTLFARTGVQFGVFTSDGVTAAARLTQLTLDANPTHTILKTDFKNAFNVLSRKLMLEEMFSYPELAPLHRMVHWAYSAESALIARGKEGIAGVVRSRQGVRQGCVFGSLAYAVATLRMLKSLKDGVGCEVVGVLDDVSLAGPPREVFAAFDKLRTMAHNHHLPLRVDKCVALWPLQDQDSFRTLLNNTDVGAEEGCMTLLGTAVGNVPAKISEWVRDKVESWAPPLRDLQSPVVPAQVALLLARTYATAKPNFLTRSLPPIYTKEPLHQHDEEVLSAVASKLNLDFSAPGVEAMLRLPFSWGGAGFTSSAAVSDHGFVASMATTLPYIAATRLRDADLPSLATVKELEASLAEISQYSPEGCPTDVAGFVGKFSVGHKDAFGLQSNLGKRFASRVVLQVSQGGAQMRSLLAARTDCPEAAAPFRAYPLTAEFTLTDDEMRFAVAHATNAKIPETPSKCTCDADFSLGHAVLCDCKMVLARHNRLQNRIAAFARVQGATVVGNPRLTIEEAANRQEPDLLLFIGTSPPLEVDVTVTDPLCPSRQSSWLKSGASLRTAEQRKRNKYELDAGTRSHEFAPLAFETYGRTGSDVLKLLRRLAANTPGEVGLSATDMMMELQIELLKGNAECGRVVFARALAQQDKARRRR